jgi:hypothetical protein
MSELSFRDQAAIAAMASLTHKNDRQGYPMSCAAVAKIAYHYADAMCDKRRGDEPNYVDKQSNSR